MFLTVLILGSSNPKHKIDMYLQSLIDELCTLWNDDILTYGMLSGWMTTGTLGYPKCMEQTKAFTIKNYGAVCYFDCHRQFLPLDHPYRRNKKAFKKRVVETSPAPPHISSLEIWNRVAHFPLCHELPQEKEHEQEQEKDIPGFGCTHNWKKHSIFWRFLYWKT